MDKHKRKILLIVLLGLVTGLIAYQDSIDNFAVLTSDLNLKVNKSGDSMTGNLNITDDNQLRVKNISTSGGTSLVIKQTTVDFNTTGGFSWEMLDSSSALRILPSGGINYIQTGTSLGSGSKTRLKFTSMFATQSYLTINAPSTNVSVDTGNLLVLGAGKGVVLKSPDGNSCGILLWRNDGNGIDTMSIACPTN